MRHMELREVFREERGLSPQLLREGQGLNSQVLQEERGLSPRILIALACVLALLLLSIVALGIYMYQHDYFVAARDSGASIAKFGYDRLS